MIFQNNPKKEFNMRKSNSFSKVSITGFLILIVCCFLPLSSQAQTTFSDEILISGQSVSSVHSADLDGDGDFDLLSASRYDDKIAWYENIDGSGTFGTQRLISSEVDGATDVFCADIDGDGDLDVVSTGDYGELVAWHENVDGSGIFGPLQVISTETEGWSVYSTDLDGDGDNDVLVASCWYDTRVEWYENTDGLGSFGEMQIIATGDDGYNCVFSIDVDGDGDNDVLVSSRNDDMIAWFENTDGLGSFGQLQVINSNANGAKSVFSADVDGDGDNDILSASELDNIIAWYENEDGLGDFGQQQVITNQTARAQSVFCADFDGDDDLDVISASDGSWNEEPKVAWYENTDGLGDFGPQQIITYDIISARAVLSADIDSDGDFDAISASSGDSKIAWYENSDGLGSFGPQQAVTSRASLASCVFSADMDNDGDLDVLSASAGDDKIAWYENRDGLGDFGPQRVVATNREDASSVFSVDLDGDGDNDILAASAGDRRVVWYENDDNPQQHLISDDARGAQCVYSADLDGDGDNDVIAACVGGGQQFGHVSWFENTDGQGNFGEVQHIANLNNAQSVFCADLDGDGDFDVLATSDIQNRVAWYENTDGLGDFGPQQIITSHADGACSVFSIDMDNDGDNDVLSASWEDNSIAGYENLDGLGTFGERIIISSQALEAKDVFAVDLDGDGDNDVLSASAGDNKIAWYEFPTGTVHVLSTNALGASSVHSADLDGDGDYDVLSASRDDSKIAWYRNLMIGLPPNPFNLVQPENGSITTSLEVQLNWHNAIDHDGDFSEYLVCVSEDPEDLGDNIIGTTTVSNFTFTGEYDTDYWWTVIATDNEDHQTWANQIFSFTILHPGLPPLPFNLLQPDSGEVVDSLTVILEWEETTDPDNNFSDYQVFISDNLDELENSDVGITPFSNYTFSGEDVTQYWWTVTARDSLNNETFANQVFSFDFETPNFPPESFNLLNPDSGSIIYSFEVPLEWEETTDPEDDFSIYRVHLSEYLDSLEQNVVIGTIETGYNFTGNSNSLYWWSVSAIDARDNVTWANQVYNFTIIADVPPLPFNLVQPDSGTVFDSLEVLLVWEQPIDTDNDLAVIRIHVSDNLDNLENIVVFATTDSFYTFTGQNSNNYWWTISARDVQNNVTWANQVFSFTIDLTSVDDGQPEIPSEYELTSIYPNPFNPSTTITIGLPESSLLQLNVYNILGQYVMMLADNQYTAGYHNFTLDGSFLPSGIYFISATIEGKFNEIRKVVLMK